MNEMNHMNAMSEMNEIDKMTEMKEMNEMNEMNVNVNVNCKRPRHPVVVDDCVGRLIIVLTMNL